MNGAKNGCRFKKQGCVFAGEACTKDEARKCDIYREYLELEKECPLARMHGYKNAACDAVCARFILIRNGGCHDNSNCKAKKFRQVFYSKQFRNNPDNIELLQEALIQT